MNTASSWYSVSFHGAGHRKLFTKLRDVKNDRRFRLHEDSTSASSMASLYSEKMGLSDIFLKGGKSENKKKGKFQCQIFFKKNKES